MKVFIPSDDEKNIAKHFGRALGFLIVELEEKNIKSKKYIKNDITNHNHSHGEHSHSSHNHDHSNIFRALEDCNTVIAGGMGRRLYDEFQEKNINVFISTEYNIDNALELFMNNKLENNSDVCCTH